MKSKYFKREEFACGCGCGFDVVDVELLEVVESVREHFDAATNITSACRCISHNHAVGGGVKSQHLLGKACDIQVDGINPERVQDYLLNKYPNSKGIGCYDTFTHVDVRQNKGRW